MRQIVTLWSELQRDFYLSAHYFVKVMPDAAIAPFNARFSLPWVTSQGRLYTHVLVSALTGRLLFFLAALAMPMIFFSTISRFASF